MQTLNSFPITITGISSMATRQVLAELAAAFEARSGYRVAIESVGGVDAAKRVQAGEAFDVVILASDALGQLADSGHVMPHSRVDLVRSPVAIAIPAGAARPDVSTEDALRQTVLAAPSLGYSTGPSGTHLSRLFERWGIQSAIQSRIVQPPPGVSVGGLLARGEVALGFQQLSEMMHVQGIEVLGTLPPGVQFITTFSAGLSTRLSADSAQALAVRAMLDFMASPEAASVKRRHGMEPA
jgi:molybdate transport system substrate-binding protein